MSRFPKLLCFALMIVAVVAAVFAGVGDREVEAEGDAYEDCGIYITGVGLNGNYNAGSTDFDSHPVGEGTIDKPAIGGTNADLRIVGVSPGEEAFAPAQRIHAACARPGADTTGDGVPDEFPISGYVWNNNIGFVSMACRSGDNEGIGCGSEEYGVVAGPEKNGENLKLTGYAWNPVYGYINFRCEGGVDYYGESCGSISYGVEMDPDGNLSGYAYSQADIYIGFAGVNMQIPEYIDDVTEGDDDDDDSTGDDDDDDDYGSTGWCDRSGWTGACVEVRTGSTPKVADGLDGYEVHVYFRNKNGAPANLGGLFLGDLKMEFRWDDEVKRDQISGEGPGFGNDGEEIPWLNSDNGGVLYKPVKNGGSYFTAADLENVSLGHYKLKKTIRSYAPTREGNVSLTTGTKDPLEFRNEIFLYNLGLPDVDPNRLILKEVRYGLTDKDGNDIVPFPGGLFAGPDGIIYANGVVDLPIRFRPAFEVSTLYADDRQDAISAYRSVPIRLKVGANKISERPGFDSLNPGIQFQLEYSDAETVSSCEDEYAGDPGVVDSFEFKFVDEDGADGTKLGTVIDGQDSFGVSYDKLKESRIGLPIDLTAVATLPDSGEDAKLCSVVQSPSLYSVVSYRPEGALTSPLVKYYSNKLPRLAGEGIANPAVVVHGNVYSQFSCSTNLEVSPISPVGDTTVSAVRDTIDRNVRSYVRNSSGFSSCLGLSNCKSFELNGEKVYYVEGDATINNFPAGSDRPVLIVDGGNLYISGNLYLPDHSVDFAVAVLRGVGQELHEGGNVYIDPAVKNIQANLVADGSVFTDLDDELLYAKGEPVSLDSYFQTLVEESNQLHWEGGISARNTIGGADYCGREQYFYRGNRPTGEKQLAQLYDLNYLRLFRLDLQTSSTGLPIDQSCGKALSAEDVVKIYNGEMVTGPGGVCDGIDPFHPYIESPGPGEISGDLVAKLNESGFAEFDDPDAEKYEPVYVDFRQSESFLFKK